MYKQTIYTVRVYFTIDMGSRQYKTSADYKSYSPLRNPTLEQRAIEKKLKDMELSLCRTYNVYSEVQ